MLLFSLLYRRAPLGKPFRLRPAEQRLAALRTACAAPCRTTATARAARPAAVTARPLGRPGYAAGPAVLIRSEVRHVE